MYRQLEKKLVKQQYLLHMSSQYGELRPTSGWDRFGSLGHPSYFQRLPRLGSVTALQSSSERQPNFAALNRGRHLCSAGRPSGWALAHILVLFHDTYCTNNHAQSYRLCEARDVLITWLLCGASVFTILTRLLPRVFEFRDALFSSGIYLFCDVKF